MQIREAVQNDILQMVACHKEAFPGQPMTEMGATWLAALYRYFLEHPKGVSIVAVDDGGTVVGLAVGGDNCIRGEFVKQAVYRYCYLIPLKLISSAVLRKTAMQILRAKFSKHHKASTVSDEVRKVLKSSGVLLSIGVIERCRGTETASRLIQCFFDVLTEQYDTARLSVRAENTRARRFYEKNGWQLISENQEEARYVKSRIEQGCNDVNASG